MKMAEIVLFHHAQGLTPGVVAFADELRSAGHTVHTPDLFDGRTFGSIDEGLGHVEEMGGFGEVMDRGARAVEGRRSASPLLLPGRASSDACTVGGFPR
jgi:dienelactone hydrolase